MKVLNKNQNKENSFKLSKIFKSSTSNIFYYFLTKRGVNFKNLSQPIKCVKTFPKNNISKM